MKVIHITPSSNGYELVTLLANRVSKTNGFSVIEKNGEYFMTGGFIISNTIEIRNILDNIAKEKQYDFIKSIKMKPFVKLYLDEDE